MLAASSGVWYSGHVQVAFYQTADRVPAQRPVFSFGTDVSLTRRMRADQKASLPKQMPQWPG